MKTPAALSATRSSASAGGLGPEGVGDAVGAGLVRSLELADDITPELLREIQARRATLQVERAATEARLDALRAGAGPEPQIPALPDLLPQGSIALDQMPEELARRASASKCTSELIRSTSGYTGTRQAKTAEARKSCRRSHLSRAPGRIRTCAHASGGSKIEGL
ncbi:hypothetical protein Pen01_36190 [Phytomonospora endophytica]|nr:hypothetical protein Pen01_36190 [Phytomonospora endophytica]